MNIDDQAAGKGAVPPTAYIVGAAALGLLAISHGIGAVKLLKDGEWVWMGLAFAVMGVYATVAERLYNAYKKAIGAR